MRRPHVVAALVLLMVGAMVGAVPAIAQDSEQAIRSLTREVEALKESQARILKELEEIKVLLRARGGTSPRDPAGVTFKLSDEPTKGDRSAKLVLLDFTDYQ
jgi:hypothetical protein